MATSMYRTYFQHSTPHHPHHPHHAPHPSSWMSDPKQLFHPGAQAAQDAATHQWMTPPRSATFGSSPYHPSPRTLYAGRDPDARPPTNPYGFAPYLLPNATHALDPDRRDCTPPDSKPPLKRSGSVGVRAADIAMTAYPLSRSGHGAEGSKGSKVSSGSPFSSIALPQGMTGCSQGLTGCTQVLTSGAPQGLTGSLCGPDQLLPDYVYAASGAGPGSIGQQNVGMFRMLSDISRIRIKSRSSSGESNFVHFLSIFVQLFLQSFVHTCT